jgi:hypothetical protein
VITTELLFGLYERPVLDGRFSFPFKNGDGARRPIELCADQKLSVDLEFFDTFPYSPMISLALRFGQVEPFGLVNAAHE